MTDRETDSERQKQRRLAKRGCGRCGEQPVKMEEWSGRWIPICNLCLAKLNAPTPSPVWCAFHEAPPSRFRRPAPSRQPVAEPDPPVETHGVEDTGVRSLLDRVIDCLYWLFGR